MSPPAAWNANHPKPHNTANTTANIRNMGSPFPSFEQRSWRASFRLSWEQQGVCQVQRQGKRERLRPSRNCCPKNTRCGLHAVKICADRARGVDRASRPRQVSPDLGQLHVLQSAKLLHGVQFVPWSSSYSFHGPVASAHVFHTVVFGRRLAPLQGRHTHGGHFMNAHTSDDKTIGSVATVT